MSDASPIYYEAMKIQPIDVIRANQSSEQLTGFLHGNCLKYLLRFNVNPSLSGTHGKGGLVDLKKARQYLDWLIELESTE